jgi:hypothetical protein
MIYDLPILFPGMLVRGPAVAPCCKLQMAPILKVMIGILIAHGFPVTGSGECARSWIHGMQGALEKQQLEDPALPIPRAAPKRTLDGPSFQL